jgi:5-formyltetrahydrofolate cyclo-ligase
MSRDEAEQAGKRVANWLSSAVEYRRCRRLVVYAELPDELPLRQVRALAQRAGKELLWPRTSGAKGLVFASVDHVEKLRPGRYGVREPGAEARVESLGRDVLVLAPGVAFDLQGGRLGRGGGLWDRALADVQGATVFGVGYELQVIERVPHEGHDCRMDGLVTEAGIRRFTRA